MSTQRSPRPRRTAEETRQRVLRVAGDLFYWNGIRATGVDRVAAEAEVAPTTLYRLFASKDDLVGAYVEDAATAYREWFDAAVESGGSDPRDQILAVFDALHEQVQPEHCRGCPYLMALAETPDPEAAAHRHAVEVKAWVRARFADLAQQLPSTTPDAETMADYLALVMEGVYGSVQASGVTGPAHRARALVEQLLPARSESITGAG